MTRRIVRIATRYDRALFLDSLLPAVRRELERTVDPTPHGFSVKAIPQAKTPVREAGR